MIDEKKIDRGKLTREIKKYALPFYIVIIILCFLVIIKPDIMFNGSGPAMFIDYKKIFGYCLLLYLLSWGMNIYCGFKYRFIKSQVITGPDILGRKALIISWVLLFINLLATFIVCWFIFK